MPDSHVAPAREAAAEAVQPPFDAAALLARWGQDHSFIASLLRKFVDRTPHDLECLQQNIGSGNIAEAARLAHGIKGAAAYVGAARVRELAVRLEEVVRTGNLGRASTYLAELQAELQRCAQYIQPAQAPAGSTRGSDNPGQQVGR